jgi:prenyltransferase beta subunit
MCVPPPGEGMTVHDGGEVDVRAAYLAVAAAHLAGLDVAALAAAGSLVRYIVRCQTYEVRCSVPSHPASAHYSQAKHLA